MDDFNEELRKLDFHDCSINSINIEAAEMLCRKVKVDIDYYNWEGNEENKGIWKWKRLYLLVNHCFHVRFICPDLVEGGFEILDVKYIETHDAIISEFNIKKPDIYYNILKEREYKNTVAVRFLTSCYGKDLFGSEYGFLEIAGFDASIEWIDEDARDGKIHIPVGE